MQFKHAQLDNGLTLVVEVNPSAASMAAAFFVRTGSRDETSRLAGVSHFLEHMMFKGTKRRNAFDINREFDEMGANYNAATSYENTVYYGAVLPEFQTRLVDLLCDMLRPSLRQEDFGVEKNVILEEIAMYQDQPHFRVQDKLMSAYFDNHPLGNSILGTNESIAALKRQDMQEYFDRRYSPGNMMVVGVGNMDFDAFVEKVSQMSSHWRPYEVTRERPSAPGVTGRCIIADEKVAREHIGIMSAAPSAQDDARYAAQLLAAIVGDTRGSRLFYALVEPAIADEASTAYEPLDGAGVFMTYISADGDRAAEAISVTQTQFARFAAEGPTDAEMLAAKNKIASSATLRGELPMGRLTAVGFDWVYRKEYIPLAEQIDRLFAVTRNDVMTVAGHYNLTAFTTVALGPMESL